MAKFDGFEPFSVQTQSDPPVTIKGIRSNAGAAASSSNLPPLLLLHGFPQTYHMWSAVAPQLADSFNVVLFDIRGYGASSKPAGIPSYAKSAMAADCIAVMDSLGFASQPFYVCAHDRGARVAHKLCVDHPSRIRRVMLLDICPTLAMFSATDFLFAKVYFHWFFLIQAAPLPEMMITSSDSRKLAQVFFGGRPGDALDFFDAANFDEYVKCLGDLETVGAMCNDYRASASLDLDEQREDLKAGRKIQCPVLALYGQKGLIARRFDAEKEWKNVTAEGVLVEAKGVPSGHYIPEELPDEVVKEVRRFFVEGETSRI
jgi:pimeloyl-ACP methyl ester carboxylesterase